MNLNKNICKILDEIPDKLPYEIFLPITTDVVKGIKPGYYISNYSRVYSKISNKYKKIKISENGYPSFCVATIGNTTHKNESVVSVHRVLMMTFMPVDNMGNLYVNHIDGIKTHSYLPNLEWTTSSENMIHAATHNLLHPSYGENHVCAKITESECIHICDLLESMKYSIKEISKITNVPESIIQSIKSGKAWKHITKNYNFQTDHDRKSKLFSYDQLCKICEYFENYPYSNEVSLQKYLKSSLEYIGFKNINQSAINSIRKLYKKERWKYIYMKYKF